METNKTRKLRTFLALLIMTGLLCSGLAEVTRGETPVPPETAQTDSKLLSEAAQPQPSSPPVPEQITPTPTPAQNLGSNEPGDQMRNTGNSYWLDDYPLNDLYQYLANQAGLQYFHSSALDGVKVTGQLYKTGDPLENMRELALQYNLVLYQRGRTIYAKTQEQIVDLPQQEFRYELKYLHPSLDELQQMLGHFLSSERASVTFEPKVNTIVVMDNESAIRRISTFLRSVDRPKRQISIQVRIISIDTTASKGAGVDWSGVLGSTGLQVSATGHLNLSSLLGTDLFKRGASVTVDTNTVSAVLRALYGNDRVSLENAPLVVTEDNEPANVSVVTRVPIVTSTVTTSNGVTNITQEVRYQIDPKDKTDPPQDRREIGTQLAVTPTILPDGTIRLLINGTVGTQTGSVVVPVSSTMSNTFPIVNESHIANLARLPAGYSLILGGFINESTTETRSKVPVLGNIPLVGYAFRSKNYSKQRTNLVFIITPIAYDANSPQQAVGVSEKNRQDYSAREEDNYADPETLGHNADIYPPQLRKALSCPSEQEIDTNPISERNPENQRALPVTTREQQKQRKLKQRYRSQTPVPRALPVDP